jgi:hypothetical protein
MKEWTVTNGASHTLEALGVALDVRARTAAPAKRSREVMGEFRRTLDQGGVGMTARTFLTYFGHASFVSYAVLRYPLCLIPGLMREQRRLARLRHYDDEDVTLSAADVREAIVWLDLLANGRFTMPAAKQRTLAEYSTDASGTGLGIVSIPAGPDAQVSRVRLDAPLGEGPIFAAEMLAGLVAARVTHRPGTWTVDNTSAAFAMIRGHSGSEVLDALLRLWILTAELPVAVRIVKSELQIADALSRTRAGDAEHDDSLHRINDAWRSVDVTHRKWTIPHALAKQRHNPTDTSN